MNKSKLLMVCFALCFAFCSNAEAKLFKWVDKDGTTHYGETIPPEYADRDTKQLDKGRVVDRDDNFDAVKKQSLKTDSTADKATLEAKRRDNALLNSYTNENEIDLARDRNLLQIEARVNSYTTLIKSAQDSLDSLLKESDSRTKSGRKIPQSLTDDIAAAEERVNKMKKDLETNKKESETVKARYEADKQRFRELKGLAPAAN
jgi:chromosome segregation ATPase